jgi:hypothetical protein
MKSSNSHEMELRHLDKGVKIMLMKPLLPFCGGNEELKRLLQ